MFAKHFEFHGAHPGRSTKVALSSRLTMRTTAECASNALKRFPRDTEGGLQDIQGRLIVPVEVDGHRDVRNVSRGSSRSTDSAQPFDLETISFVPSSKLSRYNESFPAPGMSRLLWAVLSVDIVLPVPMLILRYYVARGKTKCTMRVAMQSTIPSERMV